MYSRVFIGVVGKDGVLLPLRGTLNEESWQLTFLCFFLFCSANIIAIWHMAFISGLNAQCVVLT